LSGILKDWKPGEPSQFNALPRKVTKLVEDIPESQKPYHGPFPQRCTHCQYPVDGLMHAAWCGNKSDPKRLIFSEREQHSGMDQRRYLDEFKKLCEKEIEITTRKNSDYADANDAFANFKIIETLSSGRISASEGFVVRMSDKLQRITNLIARDNQVLDESIEDTLLDLSIYCKLFRCYLASKRAERREK